jgi:hypothetical protein
MRTSALAFAQQRRDNPEALNNTSWSVVRHPDAPVIRYYQALRTAQVACQLQPENARYLRTLGVKVQARHRFNRIVTRQEAILIVQNYIELDLKKLKEAKDDKSERKALGGLEHSVQMMKELLTFDSSLRKR